jgi:hypothetical protein
MTLTRAKVLKSSLTFSLGRVTVRLGQRFYKLGLTPKMVEEIACQVMKDLREHGNWPELEDEVKPGPLSGPR